MDTCRYNENGGRASALTRFDEPGKPHFFKKTNPTPKPSLRILRNLFQLHYLKVETVLLNLLLWPLVEMNRCVCLVGCEAGVWDHQRRGENGRWGWRSDGATGNRLHLYWGRQDLLLCNESATRRKIRRENPKPDPPPERALGSPGAAGTRLEQGLSNHAEPGESRPQIFPSPSSMDWNCRKLRYLRLYVSSMT